MVIEVDGGDEEPIPDTEVQEDKQEPLISIHALTGVPSYSTMRVRGAIGTRSLHILVDSGSTHNFLDEKLATKLNYPLQEIREMRVKVANGNQVPCKKVCPNFKWLM